VYEEADAAHDKQHDGTERVDLQRHIGRKRASENPGIEFRLDRLTRVSDQAQDNDQGTHQGAPNRTHSEEVGPIANGTSLKEAVVEQREGWKHWDQPDQNFHNARTSLVTDNS